MSLTLLIAAILAAADKQQGQEPANDSVSQPECRMFPRIGSEIERHPPKPELHNEQLQQSYDGLSRKYVHVIQEGKEPEFRAVRQKS